MKGIVVAPQARACDIGAATLERGGNVFDAAIAAAFAQEIDDPFMCGIGGMGTAQIHHAASGQTISLDFHSRGGARCRPDMYAKTLRAQAKWGRAIIVNDYRSELGYQSIMTPGTVAGLGEIHARFGSLPWADLVSPAAELARNGMWVMPFALDFWERLPQPGLADGRTRVCATEECRDLYLRPDGTFYRIGDIIPNTGLADTLERIAEAGAADFYTGVLGDRIGSDLEANDAFVTRADLVEYRAIQSEPVRATYREYDLIAAPPPASGVTLLQILKFLEGYDLRAMGHNSTEHLDLLILALKAAHTDRAEFLADPAFVAVPTDTLVSEDRAEMWRERLTRPETIATPEPVPDFGTTHISAADEDGNVVSITHTLGTGSGVVTPGMGFVYNNSMKLFDPAVGRPNAVAPGKARTTAMSPTIVFEDGRPILAVGAPGGTAILSSVSQTLINMIDFGMSPGEAVAAPRIHAEGGDVAAEARIELSVIEGLRRRGHRITRSPYAIEPTFSRAQVAEIGVDGFRGGSDPRVGGGGIAFARS